MNKKKYLKKLLKKHPLPRGSTAPKAWVMENGKIIEYQIRHFSNVDMTDEEAETLSILDNKASDTSYFDNVQLANIFKDMDQSNIELTGFCDQEVSKLLENINMDIEKVIENKKDDKSNEKESKKGILQYQLIFENEKQLTIWKNFIDEIKDKYGESICESLVLFIQDTNNKEPYF